LKGNALVATVMSNLGLEHYLNGQGIGLERTDVGDRYVVERMRSGGFNLGGEQSGHVVMTDYATTGDGLLAGLQFLSAMLETDQPASELARNFDRVPQLLKNVRFTENQDPLSKKAVKFAIGDAEKLLEKTGRLLIRKSGTEPLIRVMAECEDEAILTAAVDQVVAAIEVANTQG
jgi:phosphoglucosamine mutase